MTNYPRTTDLAVLIVRLLIGAIFIAHGAQKLFTFDVAGTAESFAGMGVPLPEAAALLAALVELLAGAALILGLATRIAGILLALDMLGAYVLVHAGNGVFIDGGGFELVAALGCAALVLAAVGAHRFSVDAVLAARRRTTRPASTAPAV